MTPTETIEKPDTPFPAFNLEERLAREARGRESGFKVFVSNLKDYFTERPVKLHGDASSPFLVDQQLKGTFSENLRDFFKPLPPEARGPSDGRMAVDLLPWYKTFVRDVRDLISPPKLPPLEVTSKPVPVRDIWTKNSQFSRVQMGSFAVHATLFLLIVAPFLSHMFSTPATLAKNTPIILTPIDISPYAAKLPAGAKKAGGGGGGGEHNPLPASKGRLPKFSWTQFTPPAVKPPENPKLAMTPTVLGPPDLHLPSPNMPNWGDPLSKSISDSSGPGSGAGIGSGCCGGVGSGQGGGVGPGEGWGTGGGAPSAGTNGYGTPTCILCPAPAYSDEAVKVKHQGVVVLSVVISADGRATGIQVVKGLGVGLDQKAIEAVRGWRFNPAKGPNGRPAATTTLIEVDFRLL
jgi:protein TonB